MKELVLRTRASKEMPAINRRVRIGIPKGWTGERHPNGRSLEMVGPNGEGKVLVAGALHPAELDDYLGQMKKSHPSAAPSPPQHMTLPGVDPARGGRATRFVITGREVGEMVLIEKNDTIVLVVLVVDPKVWPDVEKLFARVYPTVEVVDLPIPPN